MLGKRKTTKKTTSQQTNQSSFFNKPWSTSKIMDAIGFFAMMLIAVALVFRLSFKNHFNDVAKTFQVIGECMAYIVCMWLGFYWTRRKRNIGWLIAWIIAAVLITVVYIFSMI